MGSKRKISTTEYSKRGCLSCKKSHLKCEEQLPKCSRCSRRNTDCEYPKNFKNITIDVNNTECLVEKSFDLEPLSISATIAQESKTPSLLSVSERTSKLDQVPSLEESSDPIFNKELDDTHNISQSTNFNHLFQMKSDRNDIKTYQFQTIEHQPNPFKFDFLCDDEPYINFVATIRKNDPLLLVHSNTYNTKELVDFVWTMSRITRFFFTFPLFPKESFSHLQDIYFQINSSFPIFQTVLVYHASWHLSRLYNQTGYQDAYASWQQIEVVTFQQCIEYLKSGLQSAKTFVELVVLIFTVIVIFSENVGNLSWRMHLSGCYQLINKCHKHLPLVNKDNYLEVAALDLFNILVEWYRHTSFTAAISSLKGFTERKLSVSIPESFKNLDIPENGVSFLSGNCKELDSFLDLMCQELHSLNMKGIHFSGLNCVLFAITEQQPAVLKSVHEKGIKLLQNLFVIQSKYTYQRIESNDFKRDLTLRMCNLLSFQGLHLYLRFFLTGERDKLKVRMLLRELLDSFYAMPYRSSCAISRHWILYIAALVALIQRETLIYHKFIEILQLLRANGMEVHSIFILQEVEQILKKHSHDDLLSTTYDVVIC